MGLPSGQMSAYLEIWEPEGRQVVALEGERLTIGKSGSNDVPILSDRKVSRLHAALQRFQAGWCIRDLASRNGTFVNGQRVFGEHPLHAGDEIRVGSTRLLFRSEAPSEDQEPTEVEESLPGLTRRESEVLLALCRPMLSGEVFTQPASVREMAEELVVTEAAVKQHLLHLYDKFGIHEEGERRRLRLANEAVRRGAVSEAQVRDRPPRRDGED